VGHWWSIGAAWSVISSPNVGGSDIFEGWQRYRPMMWAAGTLAAASTLGGGNTGGGVACPSPSPVPIVTGYLRVSQQLSPNDVCGLLAVLRCTFQSNTLVEHWDGVAQVGIRL